MKITNTNLQERLSARVPEKPLYFRKIQSPLEKSDYSLFLINIFRLLLLTQISRVANSEAPSQREYRVYIYARNLLDVFRRTTIQSMVPQDKQQFYSYTASSLASVAAFGIDEGIDIAREAPPIGSHPRIFFAASSLVAATFVLRHASNGLLRCKNATWVETFKAIPIHLFNIGSAFLDFTLDMHPELVKDPLFSPFTEEYLNPHECKPASAKAYQKSSPLDRLLDPTLTQKLGEKRIRTTPCTRNYALILDPLNPPTDCASAKIPYRKLALETHPDKADLPETELIKLKDRCAPQCPGQRASCLNACVESLRTKAFTNLANTYEIFCSKTKKRKSNS